MESVEGERASERERERERERGRKRDALERLFLQFSPSCTIITHSARWRMKIMCESRPYNYELQDDIKRPILDFDLKVRQILRPTS